MSPRQNSNIPWWAIFLGFMCFPPVGVILLVMSLAGVQLPSSKKQNSSYVYNAQRRQTPPAGSTGTYVGPDGETVTFQHGETKADGTYHYAYSQQGQTGRTGGLRRFFKQPRSGKAMTIIGGIMSFIFGIGFVDTFIDAIRWGLWLYADEWVPLLGFLCAGIFLLGKGLSKTKESRRAKLYQNIIGQRNSIFLSDLAATAGVTQQQVISDLQKMLTDGTLPSGYIDKASKRLILTDLGYVPPEAEAAEVKKKAEPKKKAEEKPKEDPDDALLRQIREVNDAIADPAMSRKIDRIEEITRKILDYQKHNPSKSNDLRQFLNYYLPTTLKLLNAYAQMEAQGVEGENISAAKSRIEGTMDKVVEGFEKQLDQLFKLDAMDIATDVEVLERMLEKDGLGSGMTLGG